MKYFLLACSLFFAIPTFAAVNKTASDDTHIAQFKEQLETCWQTFQKDYLSESKEYIEKNYSLDSKESSGKSMMGFYNQQQKICADAFQCYQKISDQIYDIYYPQKKEDMKKYMTASIDAQINLYGYSYAQNKLCVPICGLITDITSQIDTFRNIHVYLLTVLDYIENMSK